MLVVLKIISGIVGLFSLYMALISLYSLAKIKKVKSGLKSKTEDDNSVFKYAYSSQIILIILCLLLIVGSVCILNI